MTIVPPDILVALGITEAEYVRRYHAGIDFSPLARTGRVTPRSLVAKHDVRIVGPTNMVPPRFTIDARPVNEAQFIQICTDLGLDCGDVYRAIRGRDKSEGRKAIPRAVLSEGFPMHHWLDRLRSRADRRTSRKYRRQR